ncbi:class I SAM-dependent methyltransferase [Defluviimonas sp. WL0002]|uniref:Class I SAM-dependent methyltransferase n=1 Tax=Albidovulum marisflavi TaxID=2984159 RepID=A0ABT2ZGK4_9RHOB|nr:class I SAM-dependent methyltransferase [Defluviimonas sp. WL0002]MCV2870175.1 class I SAM-dependent methyltransferase [Defluviimonas sp. WL0002]
MPPRRLKLGYATPAKGGDARLFAPSAERNAGAIIDVLHRHAPARGRALELAAGTGQHSAACAAAFPDLNWQPTDGAEAALASIAAWRDAAGLANLAEPALLDVSAPGWGAARAGQDLVLVANLLHLISAAEAKTVLGGIGQALAPGGTAVIYGPFRRQGRLTSEGDIAFDADLRLQDPEIGYKDDTWVIRSASEAGLDLVAVEQMPANNMCFIFRRQG